MGNTYILIADYDQLHRFVKILHGKTEELFTLHFFTQLKVEALKQEWFGAGAESFFTTMEDRLLPALVKVIEAMLATQDRIRGVIRTINRGDEDTRVFFSTDALTSDLFASVLFLETLSDAAKKAGVTSLVGGATSGTGTAAGGTPVTDQKDITEKKNKEARHDGIKAHHSTGHTPAPVKPPEKHEGKIHHRSARSGEMSGLSNLGDSLKGSHESGALVGGAGAAQQGALEQSASGSGGASGGTPGGGGGSGADSGGSGTPTPNIGVEGGAGLGAAAAGAAAIGAAAKVIKEDQQKE